MHVIIIEPYKKKEHFHSPQREITHVKRLILESKSEMCKMSIILCFICSTRNNRCYSCNEFYTV